LEKEAASPIGQRKELVTELGDREDYNEMYCGMECIRCAHNYIITPQKKFTTNNTVGDVKTKINQTQTDLIFIPRLIYA
jgi:hypothetical protein